MKGTDAERLNQIAKNKTNFKTCSILFIMIFLSISISQLLVGHGAAEREKILDINC